MIDLITINCVWPPHDIQEIICYNNLYLYLYNSMYFSAIVRFNMYMYIASFWWIVLNYILQNQSVVLSQTNTLGNVDTCTCIVFFFISPDVNECNSTSTNTCDSLTQECENTEGSFLCNCKNGYRKVGQACEGEL